MKHIHLYQYIVGLTLAYSNLHPQLDVQLERLSGEQPLIAYPPAPPRALGERLTSTNVSAMLSAEHGHRFPWRIARTENL
jgi:hypothetical protein